MKKNLVFVALVSMTIFMTVPAQATPVTITFDEPYASAGSTTNRYDGTHVDDEYSSLGITWVDTYSTTLPENADYTGQVVCTVSEFNGTWSDPPTNQVLWYYGIGGGGTTPVNASILLSRPATSFTVDYRRPANYGYIEFDLYMGDTLVYDCPTTEWSPEDDNEWDTFSHSGVSFDKVVIIANDKFVTDNYSFDIVPDQAPPPCLPAINLLLLGD